MSATYNFPIFKRGDTFRARDFATVTSSLDDSAMALSAARMQVRTKAGAVVHEWTTESDTPNASITGAGDNVVHLNEIEKATSKDFPPGDHRYDLEVQYAADDAWQTILEGDFPVSADVTRD